MFGKTVRKRFYIHTLLSSAACIAALSMAPDQSQARGLFSERAVVPAIEINLDAIANLKAAREAAAAEAERQALEREELAAKDVDVDDSNDAETTEYTEDFTEEGGEAPQESRLPIVIKKAEAPVAPMYNKDKLVSEEKPEASEESGDIQEPRTVASMFRDLFYSDEEKQNTAASKASPSTEVVEREEAAEEEPVASKSLQLEEPEAAEEDVEYIADSIDESDVTASPYQITERAEPQINRVETELVPEESADNEPGFFDRILDSFSDKKLQKKQSIEIEKPEVATLNETTAAPSIFADSETEFEVVGTGKELLESAEEEQLVNDTIEESVVEAEESQQVASLPSSLPAQNENVQVILPNEVDKNEDVFAFAPKPQPNPRRRVVEVEQKVASVSNTMPAPVVKKPVEAEIAEKVTEAEAKKEEIKNEVSTLEEKELPKPKTFEVEAGDDLPIVLDGSANNTDISEKENMASVEMDENPLLDEPYYTETKPAIPAPADVVERDLEEKELTAAPVAIEESAPKKNFFQKAKNWFGFGEKNEQQKLSEQTIIVPPSNEDMPEEVVENELPASLPEPVDIAALEQKLDSLAPSNSSLPEKLDVLPDDEVNEVVEQVEKAGVAAADAMVILPNEISDGLEIVDEEMDQMAEDAPVDLASLPVQVASDSIAPTVQKTDNNSLLMLEFLPTQTEILSDDRQKILGLVNKIKQDDRKRLKIKSYASQVDDSPGSARRVSLQRAIAIRSIMVENGIEGVRINVQAMGDATESGGVQDRADIIVIQD